MIADPLLSSGVTCLANRSTLLYTECLELLTNLVKSGLANSSVLPTVQNGSSDRSI